MAVTDVWADWSSTAASNSPAGGISPEIDDELRNIKAQVKGNVIGLTAVATQAQQETGTATTVFVAPGRQQYHASACKAWAKFTATGSVVVGYNVASITDDGTGLATIVIATDFSGADYAITLSLIDDEVKFVQVTEPGGAAGSIQVNCRNTSGTLVDPLGFNATLFGDQ